MRITVEMKGSSKKLVIPDGSMISDLARRIGVYPDSAIFIMNEKIAPSDEEIVSGSRVRVLPAASGG